MPTKNEIAEARARAAAELDDEPASKPAAKPAPAPPSKPKGTVHHAKASAKLVPRPTVKGWKALTPIRYINTSGEDRTVDERDGILTDLPAELAADLTAKGLVAPAL